MAILILIKPVTSFSATTPIEAHAVYVEGVVNYVSVEDSVTYPVELNTPFREGDRVITGKDGMVEIEFDTGALLLLDNDTDVTIKSLHINDQGAVSAIFYLAVGLIKSSFSKLADMDQVEYHTKAAIAGISGTPNQVVKADTTDEGVARTDIYLLGEEGDEGSMFARGFDPDMTEVTLTANRGTTVFEGLPPAAPFVLTPAILYLLNQYVFQSTSAAGGAGGAAGTTAGATGGGAAGGATAATTATTAGISGTTVVIGGAALAGVAVAAGSSGGGGDSGGGETTAPSEPETPTEPTTPTEPEIEEKSPFRGQISGRWGGSCHDEHGSESTGGSFTMNISEDGTVSGSYSGDGSGSLSGNVNISGDFASGGGAAGGGNWSGSFSVSGNNLSGSGSWSSADEFESCSGTWSGSGQKF